MRALIISLLLCGSLFAQSFPLEMVAEFELPENEGYDVQFWMDEHELGWASFLENTISYKYTLDSPEQTYVVPDTLEVELISLIRWDGNPAILVCGLGISEYSFNPTIRSRYAVVIDLVSEEVVTHFSRGVYYDYNNGYDNQRFSYCRVFPRLPLNTSHLLFTWQRREFYDFQSWERIKTDRIAIVDLNVDPIDSEFIGSGSRFDCFRDEQSMLIGISSTSEHVTESGFNLYEGDYGVVTSDTFLFSTENECTFQAMDPCRYLASCSQTDRDGTKRLILSRGEAYDAATGELLWQKETTLNSSSEIDATLFSAILDSSGNERICSRSGSYSGLVVYDGATGDWLGSSSELYQISHVLKTSSGVDYIVTRSPTSIKVYRSALIDPVGETEPVSVPSDFTVCAYPNPFNPTTTISFTLPATGETSIAVLNLLGQTVEQVDLGTLTSGSHEYRFDASALPSGIYFAQVSTPTQSKIQKLLLTK